MNDWIKTVERLPEKETLVEVKSDYFPDGANYAILADTEQGIEWFYFGTDPVNNKITRMGLEVISEWRSVGADVYEKFHISHTLGQLQIYMIKE